jgi:hypothetical protein
MEHEAYPDPPHLEGVRDCLADQDLTQVADVDVAGGANPGHDHVRAFTVANQ